MSCNEAEYTRHFWTDFDKFQNLAKTEKDFSRKIVQKFFLISKCSFLQCIRIAQEKDCWNEKNLNLVESGFSQFFLQHAPEK